MISLPEVNWRSEYYTDVGGRTITSYILFSFVTLIENAIVIFIDQIFYYSFLSIPTECPKY